MQREDYIKDLKQENEELQFQLKDLEYLIQLKEEELADSDTSAADIYDGMVGGAGEEGGEEGEKNVSLASLEERVSFK